MNQDYYKYPQELMSASGFVSKTTGEAIHLTPLAKSVYVYMRHRNNFFVGSLEGQHYETQQTIAEACDSDYKVIGKILRTFIDNGILSATKLRPNGTGQWRWFYHGIADELVLWKRSVVVLGRSKPADAIYETPIDNPSIDEYSDDFLNSVDFGVNE